MITALETYIQNKHLLKDTSYQTLEELKKKVLTKADNEFVGCLEEKLIESINSARFKIFYIRIPYPKTVSKLVPLDEFVQHFKLILPSKIPYGFIYKEIVIKMFKEMNLVYLVIAPDNSYEN